MLVRQQREHPRPGQADGSSCASSVSPGAPHLHSVVLGYPNHAVAARGESHASGGPTHLLTQFVLKVKTWWEPRIRSIGCGLGVASLGLIDIPLLLLNCVIGLGERGRVLLISIWLAALGARMLAQSFAPLRLRSVWWWRNARAGALVSGG